jgi:hypothetical protein
MDLVVYRDYSKSPEAFGLTWPRSSGESSGLQTTKDQAAAVVDLTQDHGFAYLTLDSWKEYNEWRGDNISVKLSGFSGRDPIVIYEIGIDGAVE